MDKLLAAYYTILETGEKLPVLDQNNEPVIVTLAEALKLKFEGFPYNFAGVREIFDVIEIELN